MSQANDLALRREILLRTATLQQASVQLQCGQLKGHRVVRALAWAGNRGMRSAVASVLARWLSQWRVS